MNTEGVENLGGDPARHGRVVCENRAYVVVIGSSCVCSSSELIPPVERHRERT